MKKHLFHTISRVMAAAVCAAALLGAPAPLQAATPIDVSQTVIWKPDPYAYVLPDSSAYYIAVEELDGFSDLYLLIARNEFYAKHGYIFNDENIARYFNAKEWYQGTTYSDSFSEDEFNQYEQHNLDVIRALERQRGSTTTTITWTDTPPAPKTSVSQTPIDVTQTVIWEPMADAYVFADSSKRYLSADELSHFSDLYLLIARNEIYARRGYIFSDTNIANYFQGKNWYQGTADTYHFSGEVFNDYEQANIDLIKSVERQRGSTTTTIAWTEGSPSAVPVETPIDVTQTVIWDPMNDAYVLPDGSSRYLSADELSDFSNLYLLIARNEFFAKHGYIFNDSNISRYFNDKTWYYGDVSSSNFDESVFNEYERANIDLIRSIETQRGSRVTTIAWEDL